MKLPNLSYMMSVAQLRYIQSIYESPERRNPDSMIREFLSPVQRWSCDLRGRLFLSRLRSQPFYFYVLARTRYYDEVFVDAIADGIQRILNVGCGSDTRAHRFAQSIRDNGVQVLECDQLSAIESKRHIAQQRWPEDRVDYASIDLNHRFWPELDVWMTRNSNSTMLVLMEGVSPYVDNDAFGRFLEYLARKLKPGSRVAYDFKLCGVNNSFGHSKQVAQPFRLSGMTEQIAGYHTSRGFEVAAFQLSAELERRVLALPADADIRLFKEDGLVQLVVPKAEHA